MAGLNKNLYGRASKLDKDPSLGLLSASADVSELEIVVAVIKTVVENVKIQTIVSAELIEKIRNLEQRVQSRETAETRNCAACSKTNQKLSKCMYDCHTLESNEILNSGKMELRYL